MTLSTRALRRLLVSAAALAVASAGMASSSWDGEGVVTADMCNPGGGAIFPTDDDSPLCAVLPHCVTYDFTGRQVCVSGAGVTLD